MAIVSISRIQHRRGLSEDLGPTTLASAELGWSIDTRQLYIGNGTLEEGAPTIGRTEILTEYSDILGLFATYTYKGQNGGYVVQTGPSAGADATRSLQDKLDDFVNFRDFVTAADISSGDYTTALNRAMEQLFCQQSNTEVRRVLYIPAGSYTISGKVKIPTFATIIGDGKESTIIRQTGADLAFELSDSKFQVETNIGNNGGVPPSYIDVRDLTFVNTQDEPVGNIYAARECRFVNVAFRGNRANPTDQGIGNISLITVGSSPSLVTGNIYFENCDFTNGTNVAHLNGDMQNIVFSGCYFNLLYQGFRVGELVDGPKGVRIINSYFDQVASTAIRVYPGNKSVSSAFNFYRDVGNGFGPTPVDPIIIFEDDNNTSIGDLFERDDADDASVPRVQHIDTSTIVQYPGELHLGSLRLGTGKTITLLDNQVNAITGIELPTGSSVALIEYSLTRNSAVRIGTIKLIEVGANVEIEDDFIFNGSDGGIVFNISNAGNGLIYTSTSTGVNATFKYSLRYVR